jgi:hypothetical protein
MRGELVRLRKGCRLTRDLVALDLGVVGTELIRIEGDDSSIT